MQRACQGKGTIQAHAAYLVSLLLMSLRHATAAVGSAICLATAHKVVAVAEALVVSAVEPRVAKNATSAVKSDTSLVTATNPATVEVSVVDAVVVAASAAATAEEDLVVAVSSATRAADMAT